jgi:hypothetical protein
MHHSVLIVVNLLVIAETVLTVSALAACLCAGTKNPVPTMRDYLIVRAANAAGIQIFLLWPGRSLLLSNATGLSLTVYYYWYWSSAFALLLLEMRVAAGAMEVFFRDLPGLQALFRLASRWIAITGVIVMIPLLLAIAVNFTSRRATLHWFQRGFYVFSAVELVPVVFALLVGKVRKVRWRSTTVAILAGFVFEPMFNLIGPWPWTSNLWVQDLASIVNEIVCCAAVGLWMICFVAPDEETSLARPTPAMLGLDKLALGALRQRRLVARPEVAAPAGAQPWPKVRRGA